MNNFRNQELVFLLSLFSTKTSYPLVLSRHMYVPIGYLFLYIAQNAIVFGDMYLRLCGLREVGIITKNTNYLISKTIVIGY